MFLLKLSTCQLTSGRAGRSLSTRWCVTRTITASQCATWRTLILWVYTQVSPLSLHHHKPWTTRSTTGCVSVLWRLSDILDTWHVCVGSSGLTTLAFAEGHLSGWGWQLMLTIMTMMMTDNDGEYEVVEKYDEFFLWSVVLPGKLTCPLKKSMVGSDVFPIERLSLFRGHSLVFGGV